MTLITTKWMVSATVLMFAGVLVTGGCRTGASSRKTTVAGDTHCPQGVCAADAVKEKKPAPTMELAGGYTEITSADLAMLLDSGEDVVVLDARVGQWDDGRRLPGAQTLSPQATEAEALAVIGDKDQLVVTYCTNAQCPASKLLANRLLDLGFSQVMKYPEGIDEWQAQGYDVETAE